MAPMEELVDLPPELELQVYKMIDPGERSNSNVIDVLFSISPALQEPRFRSELYEYYYGRDVRCSETRSMDTFALYALMYTIPTLYDPMIHVSKVGTNWFQMLDDFIAYGAHKPLRVMLDNSQHMVRPDPERTLVRFRRSLGMGQTLIPLMLMSLNDENVASECAKAGRFELLDRPELWECQFCNSDVGAAFLFISKEYHRIGEAQRRACVYFLKRAFAERVVLSKDDLGVRATVGAALIKAIDIPELYMPVLEGLKAFDPSWWQSIMKLRTRDSFEFMKRVDERDLSDGHLRHPCQSFGLKFSSGPEYVALVLGHEWRSKYSTSVGGRYAVNARARYELLCTVMCEAIMEGPERWDAHLGLLRNHESQAREMAQFIGTSEEDDVRVYRSNMSNVKPFLAALFST